MERFERLKERIWRINRLVSVIGSFSLIPLMLLTTAEVVSRKFFNRPIAGTVEISEYLLSIFILLGLAYAQQMKAHVSVSLFASRMSHRIKSIIQIVTTLISLAICILLAWQGLAVGLEERTVSDLLRIPQYPFRLLVALAAFMTCLELIIDLGITGGSVTNGQSHES